MPYPKHNPKPIWAVLLCFFGATVASCSQPSADGKADGKANGTAASNPAATLQEGAHSDTQAAQSFDITQPKNRERLALVIEKEQLIDVAEVDLEVDRIRQDLLIDQYMERLYSDAVDDTAIEKYYRDNIEDYQISRVRMAHVFLRTPAGASQEVKDAVATRAQEVIAKLHTGEPFPTVVERYSEDERSVTKNGELGWVSAGDIDESVMQAALSLNIDEVSAPVVTNYGIHIIKKQSDIEHLPRPLSQVRASIRSSLRAKAKADALNKLAAAE